jgi:putative Mn2+ efflux pump MntP
MAKNNSQNKLTRKEQSTTTAYKLMSEKINNLEASLKKTQDEAEKGRSEKYETEKKNILLEAKLKDYWLITFLEFISSAGFGFSLSFITSQNWMFVFAIGTPSLIIYILCLYLTKK